jgi:hypothetical protein
MLMFSISPGSAQTNEFLRQQFAYTLVLHTRKVDHYLNYQGSQLKPVYQTDVLLNDRPYEKFWHYQGKPLGVRRQFKMTVDESDLGAVVIRQADGGTDGVRAAANVALRIISEARVNRFTVSTVFVPDDLYSDVSNELTRYNFSTKPCSEDGEQFSITLKCASGAKEEQLFYQRK